MCLFCCAHRNILNLPCLVHGDSSGAGGSLFSGHGGHSQPPAPLSLRWKRLLRDPVRAPDSSSCPEEASASELSPGGLPVPVGCPVPVLSCLFSPGGLLIPPNFPREIFWGGRKGSGCGGRAEGTEAKAPKTTCHGLLSSLHRHGLQSSQLHHGPCLSVPLWRSPSCVPVRVCPEGPPERPPPLPDGTVKARDEPFREGGVMSVLCRVCHVFPPLVSIFGLFPVLVSCHYELSMFQLCLCDCVNYPVYLVPVF